MSTRDKKIETQGRLKMKNVNKKGAEERQLDVDDLRHVRLL